VINNKGLIVKFKLRFESLNYKHFLKKRPKRYSLLRRYTLNLYHKGAVSFDFVKFPNRFWAISTGGPTNKSW